MSFACRSRSRRLLTARMSSSGLAAELVLARWSDSVRVRTERSLIRLFDAAEHAVTFAQSPFGSPLLGQLLGPFTPCFACRLVAHFRSTQRVNRSHRFHQHRHPLASTDTR